MITQEQINQHWDVRADMYDGHVRGELASDRAQEWINLIEENAPHTRPLHVLDAGCGPGFFFRNIARRQFKPVFLPDTSDKMR